MFNDISSFFQQISHMSNGLNQQPHPQQRRRQQPNKPPPASKKVLAELPLVQVTADDLIEETNKECLICLDEQFIGSFSCKLPCGHLFHKPCLTEWLGKQCTCPVCRYELETDDTTFEAERRKRMKKRKLRLRKDELKSKSVAQLKDLCSQLSINITNCIDKNEIVDIIIKSNKIIITENIPPLEMKESDFFRKNVSELKHLLLMFGLNADGALEKADLRGRLIESGRVILVSDDAIIPDSQNGSLDEEEEGQLTNDSSHDEKDQEEQQTGEKSDGGIETDHSGRTAVTSSARSGSGRTALTSEVTTSDIKEDPLSPSSSGASSMSYSKEELRSMSLTALRELCRRFNVDTSSCIDKGDIVDSLSDSGKVRRDPSFSPPRAEPKIKSNLSSPTAAGSKGKAFVGFLCTFINIFVSFRELSYRSFWIRFCK
jgi:hypothetical protein